MTSPGGCKPLSISEKLSIDALCEQFEGEWQAQRQPQLEQVLDQAPAQLRGPLLCALVPIDFHWQRQRGAAPDLTSYQRRFPGWAAWLEGLVIHCDSSHQQAITLDKAAAPPAPAQLELGTQVGKYRLISELGRGTFGTVYKAVHVELNREVALKVCVIPGDEEAALQQYRDEGQTLARLKHKHIVGVYDAWIEGINYLVASELIDGPSLRTVLENKQPLDHKKAALIALQIARALALAHQATLVHRDVKPANILLRGDGDAVLVDFGLAFRREAFSLRKDLSGTPQYMSPEQADGNANALDGRSDIYSLGVVLYEMLTATRPHTGRTMDDLLEAIKTVDPVPPRQVVPSIPTRLEAICLRCLAKNPSVRYQNASDLAADLKSFLNPRWWWAWIVCGAVLAAVLAIMVRSWTSSAVIPNPPPAVRLARVEQAELHVQRGEADGSPIDSLLLVKNGVDQHLPAAVTPLDRDDRMVLYYRFAEPTSWLLVHVDPAGGAAIVARSEEPQLEARVPKNTNRGVAFSSSDPRGLNLLILLAGELPDGTKDNDLIEQIRTAQSNVDAKPVWSQLRSGFEEKSAAVQLPQDYLRDVESRLPSGLTPRHALLLQTIEAGSPPADGSR